MEYPAFLSKTPIDETKTPFPIEEQTPPVTTIKFMPLSATNFSFSASFTDSPSQQVFIKSKYPKIIANFYRKYPYLLK
jgi:hypothetical protein